MDENGGHPILPNSYRPQEAFQRAQEAQVEHRFPTNPTGIVPLPRGSRGPKSLYLRRYGDSFGFTLRHFIIYPPDSVTESDGRHAAVGALLSPMDTIFVKHVKDRSPAKQAGLQRGDRLVAVNGVPIKDKPYSQVVQLIQNSPEYLHLLVVPKEEDVLQRFFAKTAYNPASNQPIYPETPLDRHTAQQIISQRITQRAPEFQVDAISWRSLQQPYGQTELAALQRPNYERGQRSADDLLYSEPRPRANQISHQQEIYAEIHPHDIGHRQKSRAVPQVPLYKKMGRRASEGSMLSDREQFEPPDYYSVNSSDVDDYNMKAIYKSNYLPETSQNSDMPGLNYPNTANYRLSLDGGRRESTGSLSSSLADGSKDSLASFGSSSTLTGQEKDDYIMSRFRKNVQQKEEFLKMPTNAEQAAIRREFYGRPKKLERQMWPPNEPIRQESPSRTTKPTHQNFLRVKNDIDIERDLTVQNQNGHQMVSGDAAYMVPQQRMAASPRNRAGFGSVERAYEASTAPGGFDDVEDVNGSAAFQDASGEVTEEKRVYPPGLQIVYKRAKDFESGRPLPEDDPVPGNRMNFSRSELARLSSKKLVPNVCERAQEYETRTVEPKRDTSGTSTNSGNSVLKRIQRDSRSLDSSGSYESCSSIIELPLGGSRGLSGNVIISSGSKYLHCPPPPDYGSQPTDTSGNEAIKVRARSNSAESWVAALGDDRNKEGAKRISRQDAVVTERNKAKESETAMDVTAHPPYGDLPPLIPEPVEHIHLAPTVSITPAPATADPSKAVRPTQLDLEGPVRPARHLKPPSTNVDSPVRRSSSPNSEDERAMRRESYLKATEGGRMHIDSDLSDGGEVSSQVLRSAHRRWRPPVFPGDIQQLRRLFEDAASSLGGSASSSSASLDREKISSSPGPLDKDKYSVIREGTVHCKILEIDGKRATDRSWKQVFVVLKGPKLFIYKDRHHQSPIGTSDALDHSLASGVDMRTSVVRVAEDYTKRKNVLRVSAVKPCRSEFLLQAESTEEFADWVKTLQEQVAESTDAELFPSVRFINHLPQDPANSKQQAVPQMVPASTTIQVQGSHLSPQLSKSKTTASRNRSPTGQSPVSKTRKPSQVPDPTTSPKLKTWRGRMAKQFRKFNQGANSPSSPTAPEGSTFGIPIEDCLPSVSNIYVPRFVEVCTEVIEERGLQTVGIYRVPGNNASITALTEEINKNYDDVPLEDPRWNDLHVVSSLLKSYFRKMPESLVTDQLYPNFIKADKIEDPKLRMEELKRLVRSLPKHNYHTLKYLIMHLKRVADNSKVNKMEAKNLAIVFGPTIVRPEGENMENMVNHMNNQCKIIESLISNADWFFPENDEEEMAPVPLALRDGYEESESANNQALLLHNISKYEALKDQKEKNGALFSSIISAAQRKVKRKPTKGTGSLPETKDEPVSPTNLKVFPSQSFSPNDLKDSTSPDGKLNEDIPTTVMDIEKKTKPTEKVPWFNYSTDKDDFHRRIQNFKQETEAMLQLPRKTEISINNIDSRPAGQLSSSASNVNQNVRLSMKPADLHLLTKTHSASNVFARATIADNRNSLNSMDTNTFSIVQYPGKNVGDKSDLNDSSYRYMSASGTKQFSDVSGTSKNSNVSAGGAFNKGAYSDVTDGGACDRRGRCNVRRGSSVENVNSSSVDLSNGNMKKIKYENENESQRTGSLDSLNKLPNDDESLLSTMTKLIDEKLKEEHTHPSLLAGEDIPFADESPEKHANKSSYLDKEITPRASDLYRNPSLHKSQFSTSSKSYKEDVLHKESKKDREKEEDTWASENVPDNDRHIAPHKLTLISKTNKLNQNQTATGAKLKRSESLNKPERTGSPLNNKLKRSESLNKTGDKLKRSDSLTKTEKTESNINKRRELSISKRGKDSTKHKRKNGMPDRSIKRRHTVGGTKDPDKVTWLRDNKSQEENDADAENAKEKNLRTSSPDLSSTRRDRLLFEINLIGPENMVVALRQHLMGARPQSFPETTVFKVPLESHV
ncbi:rho GTPase-activating protein 21 isoform X4 [Anoplophora glabripennis]|uniref:rho GTPase-activating protein 21 isoform X4 n=1 Tax=Anoplophora glabripennis TaxID=217634 RepID=UPI0008745D7E|nr:rho GTPase-activating protein 21 isoform X4 [Anoplophora glabripennis]